MTVRVTLRLINDAGEVAATVESDDASGKAAAQAALDAVAVIADDKAGRGKTFEEKVVTGEVAAAPAPKAPRSKKPPVVVVDSAKDPTGDPTADPTPKANISTGEDRKDPENPDPLDDPFTADETPVTDKEVSDAIIRAQKRLNDVASIKALIGKVGVKHFSAIPQPVRKQFIADLEALK